MTGRIDAYTSMVAYASHLTPILNALPEERRGHLYAPTNLRRELPDGTRFDVAQAYRSAAPILVAGFQDLTFSRRPKIFCSHGAGQVYEGAPDQPSYDGGAGRELVDLFLCPSQRSLDRNLARYPRARGAVVGCPKLDHYMTIPKPVNVDPVVAVAWHWPCHLRADDGKSIPESGWAFPTWRDAVAELSKQMKVLGHGHPRARRELEPWYASVGIESVWSVEELLARADCFVVDNSSLGFEMTACDRPTVWLDDTSWRRDVEHGLRFGEELPGTRLGTALGDSSSLLGAVVCAELAHADDVEMIDRRRRVSERVYGGVPDGKAAARAERAILDFEEERST